MVLKSVSKIIKRFFIPFATVSSVFLFTGFDSAKAETVNGWSKFIERGDVSKGHFSKDAILERGGSVNEFMDVIERLGTVIDWIIKAGEWVIALPSNIVPYSIWIYTKVFETLMFLIQTPLFIFNNSGITNTTLIFSGVSIVIVTVLTMVEMIKRMIKKKRSEDIMSLPNQFTDIIKRWSLASVGAGFAPFLFEQTFHFLNKITRAITSIGSGTIQTADVHWALDGFNVTLMLGFDVIVLLLMYQFIMQNARRWFDLACLTTITPLALSAWVFDDYRHLFVQWWNGVKKRGLVQLVYATFICIIGALMFATAGKITFWGSVTKICFAIGGLHALVNPPQIVLSRLDNGKDIADLGKDYYKSV
mgnify:CR=1 FL=1